MSFELDLDFLYTALAIAAILFGTFAKLYSSADGQRAVALVAFRNLHFQKIASDRKSISISGGEIRDRSCQITYSLDKALPKAIIRFLSAQSPVFIDRMVMKIHCNSSMLFSVSRKGNGFHFGSSNGSEGFEEIDPPSDHFGTQLVYKTDQPERMTSWLQESIVISDLGWMFFSMGVEQLVLCNEFLTCTIPKPIAFTFKEENLRRCMESLVEMAEKLETANAGSLCH